MRRGLMRERSGRKPYYGPSIGSSGKLRAETSSEEFRRGLAILSSRKGAKGPRSAPRERPRRWAMGAGDDASEPTGRLRRQTRSASPDRRPAGDCRREAAVRSRTLRGATDTSIRGESRANKTRHAFAPAPSCDLPPVGTGPRGLWPLSAGGVLRRIPLDPFIC